MVVSATIGNGDSMLIDGMGEARRFATRQGVGGWIFSIP